MLNITEEESIEAPGTQHQCIICGSKAIGINFGVLTCAPCKAFFRRNARRKEILLSSCHHRDINQLFTDYANEQSITNRYLQTRRCTSCRLRRCFYVGMKEDLVRTEEENIRHKKLVELNRKKRDFLKYMEEEKQLTVSKCLLSNNQILRELDWTHLSNIVSAYETHCLKIYLQQRSAIFTDGTISLQMERAPLKPFVKLPMYLAVSLSSFFQSLPAFHSLSPTTRAYLCKTNVRALIFPNMYEIKQTCFSEPWQVSFEKSLWEDICGSELFQDFLTIDRISARSLVGDPIIIRLWLIILFFSSPLFCIYETSILKVPKKKTPIIEIQNIYATLLWKYLLYRYGNHYAAQIYSNLILTFLKMQRVGFDIGIRIRTCQEVLVTHEVLNKILTVDINNQ